MVKYLEGNSDDNKDGGPGDAVVTIYTWDDAECDYKKMNLDVCKCGQCCQRFTWDVGRRRLNL